MELVLPLEARQICDVVVQRAESCQVEASKTQLSALKSESTPHHWGVATRFVGGAGSVPEVEPVVEPPE
jgi:hypothetical protein